MKMVNRYSHERWIAAVVQAGARDRRAIRESIGLGRLSLIMYGWGYGDPPTGVEMRLTILFWNFNIQKGNLMRREPDNASRAAVLARVARHHDIDILALCECEIAEDEILNALRAEDARYDQPANPHERFKFFTRFPGEELEAFARRRPARRAPVPSRWVQRYPPGRVSFHRWLEQFRREATRCTCDTYKQTLAEAEDRAGTPGQSCSAT